MGGVEDCGGRGKVCSGKGAWCVGRSGVCERGMDVGGGKVKCGWGR